MTTDSRSYPVVFVGCATEDLAIAQAVQERLDYVAEVEIWTEGAFVPSGQAVSSLVSAAQRVDFAVFVVSGTDTLSSREAVALVPRDNVVFELGLFMGALGHDRALILKDRASDPRLPTDLDGVTALTFDRRKQNAASAVGAACTQLTRVIEETGRREADG